MIASSLYAGSTAEILNPDPDVEAILQIVPFDMPGPVLDLNTLLARLTPDLRVVLTNGVFDLLHVGHLRYLRRARELGDVLVVGVNADGTVHKPGRPLIPDFERAELVAALEPVDYVVIFGEDTADELLRAVRPSIYAKGADYSEASLPEAVTAHAIGAQVVLLPLTDQRSSSRMIRMLEEIRQD